MKVFIRADNDEDLAACKNYFSKFNFTIVDSAELCDIIVISESERVDSKVYGVTDTINDKASKRNEVRTLTNLMLFNTYYSHKKFICFGTASILMAALAGSKIIHVAYDHFNSHFVKFNGHIDSILLPSEHSQIIYPYNLTSDEYVVIGSAYPNLSYGRYMRDKTEKFQVPLRNFNEPEVLYFERLQALCFMSKAYKTITETNKQRIKKIIDQYT